MLSIFCFLKFIFPFTFLIRQVGLPVFVLGQVSELTEVLGGGMLIFKMLANTLCQRSAVFLSVGGG